MFACFFVYCGYMRTSLYRFAGISEYEMIVDGGSGGRLLFDAHGDEKISSELHISGMFPYGDASCLMPPDDCTTRWYQKMLRNRSVKSDNSAGILEGQIKNAFVIFEGHIE